MLRVKLKSENINVSPPISVESNGMVVNENVSITVLLISSVSRPLNFLKRLSDTMEEFRNEHLSNVTLQLVEES